MPEYGRFCTVAMTSEVLADRWTPLIVRELVLGTVRFNDIARGMPGISRTLLAQRLRHLERRGVLETWPSPLDGPRVVGFCGPRGDSDASATQRRSRTRRTAAKAKGEV